MPLFFFSLINALYSVGDRGFHSLGLKESQKLWLELYFHYLKSSFCVHIVTPSFDVMLLPYKKENEKKNFNNAGNITCRVKILGFLKTIG